MTLALGTIILIVIITAGSLSAGYFFYTAYQQNRSQKSANQATSSTTSKTSQVDLTQKCIDAGGVCKIDCSSATTGSVSGSFFDNLYAYLASLFSRTNSAATVGSVVNIPQEIGTYPNFCIAQLPKCCLSSTSSATTISTSTVSTQTSTVSISTSEYDQAVNFLANELNSVSQINASDIENGLLH